MKIAALFVETNGVYFNLPNIIPYDIHNDARNYNGPYPVIAHPPCERWGKYWSGGPSSRVKKFLGNDFGCFDRALFAVRTFGGVIEHPAYSKAFDWFGIDRPKPYDGWYEVDNFGGFACQIDQNIYGHKAKKATYLYSCKFKRFLKVKKQKAQSFIKIDEGFHSKKQADLIRLQKNFIPCKRLSEKDRIDTPIKFRNFLIRCVEFGLS